MLVAYYYSPLCILMCQHTVLKTGPVMTQYFTVKFLNRVSYGVIGSFSICTLF